MYERFSFISTRRKSETSTSTQKTKMGLDNTGTAVLFLSLLLIGILSFSMKGKLKQQDYP